MRLEWAILEWRLNKPRFVFRLFGKYLGPSLMILAMVCNIMASAKFFCVVKKPITSDLGHGFAFAKASENSVLAMSLGSSNNSLSTSGSQLPRCSCKNTKKCAPISWFTLTSNSLQRFNEDQRSVRSAEHDAGAFLHRRNCLSKGCRRPALGELGGFDVTTFHDNVLSHACVLLI